MGEINVLDIGCGDASFEDNWLSQEPRTLQQLWYPQGADQRNFRNISQAVKLLMPEIKKVNVTGVDKIGTNQPSKQAIIDDVRVRISKVKSCFENFAKYSKIPPVNLAILAHPNSLEILRQSHNNGIEALIERLVSPQGTLCIATDLTQRPKYRSTINRVVGRIEALGLRLNPEKKFDSSWSPYYLPGHTHSLVFSRS